MNEFNSIREILDTCGQYTGLTVGTSMNPLIHHQKDNIIVVKNKERLKKYDVPVYQDKNGKYIMHRIVEVHPDHYIIIGDNLMAKEYVTDDMIVASQWAFTKTASTTLIAKTTSCTSFIHGCGWLCILCVPYIILQSVV